MTAQRATQDLTLTAAQCAKRTGLTVKALRVYEREGLLTPKRTMKDWRIYDAADLARLGEVAALRALGLKLADIREVLKGKPGEISRMLELQQEDLMARRAQVESALLRVENLRQRAAMGETLSLNDLTQTIKETNMTSPSSEAISWKRYEQMRPRKAIAVDVAAMKACEGHYLLDQTSVLHVFMENGQFKAQLTAQPALQIYAEGDERYFYTAVPAQLVFDRGSDGNIIGVTLHQHGGEIILPRISSAEAERVIAATKSRVLSGTPAKTSKEVLEAILHGHKTQPRYDLMAPELALLAQEQKETITQNFKELGEFVSLKFISVSPQGMDFYRARFEKGELDCGIYLGGDGKAHGVTLEPPKTDSFWNALKSQFLSS
jgi:DNA-binding transcriptional MerR regulator